MLFGDFPYKVAIKNGDLMKAAIRDGVQTITYTARADLPQPSKEACKFAAQLLDRDMDKRPGAAELLDSSVFLRPPTPKKAQQLSVHCSVVIPGQLSEATPAHEPPAAVA